MPPKKQIALQEALETQQDWQNVTGKDGLTVVDVYSAWCGPCKAVVGLLRRVKNEIGDDLLRFAIAKSDTIDTLEPYRNHSEPTFLMYSGGVMVGVVRGALGPQLEKTIRQQLDYEHQVLEGKAERVAVVDERLNEQIVLEEDRDPTPVQEEPKIEPKRKELSLLVIKPDAVRAGKVDEILETVEAKGLEVLLKEERQLTKEEAAEFYKQHEGSEHFEELIEFMSSGPCMTLVLSKGDTGEGVVEELRELIGPTDTELAKQAAPDSLRAQYGTDSRENAVHASDSHDTAARELAFFFPRYSVPWVPGTAPPIERTLALIRPDVLAQFRDSIIEKIAEAGFEIALQKELHLSKEEAAEFYKEHEGQDYFDSLCTHMSSGPMMALCLAREDAIGEWRKLLGPKELEEAIKEAPESFRAQFSVEGAPHNGLHGSTSSEDVTKEVQFFFPVEQTVAVIKPGIYDNKDAIVSKIKEAGFKVSLSKETHLTKEMAEQLYGEHKGKEFFESLTDTMSSGPSVFMVLTREDAISGWRALMGPVDPELAKQQDLNSLRALFGSSVLENAVHGSSNKERAEKELEAFFGHVEFDLDGTVKGGEGEGVTSDGGEGGDPALEPTDTPAAGQDTQA